MPLTIEQEYRARLQARAVQMGIVAQQAIRAIVNRLSGKRVSFTGALGFMTRDVAVGHVQQLGGKYDAFPRWGTHIVVCGDIPMTAMQPGHCSRKLQKAHSLGIEVVSATTFRAMLEEAGVRP